MDKFASLPGLGVNRLVDNPERPCGTCILISRVHHTPCVGCNTAQPNADLPYLALTGLHMRERHRPIGRKGFTGCRSLLHAWNHTSPILHRYRPCFDNMHQPLLCIDFASLFLQSSFATASSDMCNYQICPHLLRSASLSFAPTSGAFSMRR